MKTMLIGNGFNIGLGGREYTNKAIINRLLSNIRTKDYSHIFGGEVSNDQLYTLVFDIFEEFMQMLNGQYDKYCVEPENSFLLAMLKERYNLKPRLNEIGMEDFFIILRIFHVRFKDDAKMIKATHDGFCLMFLDAIFNEGQIQEIYSTISPALKLHLSTILSEYNNIYTVNYDKTVEMILGNSIYYLHGDFETLLDQYDPNTLIGYYYRENGVNNPVTPATKHIYCNGLMGFSGAYKEYIMNIMENGQFGVEEILKKYNIGLAAQDLAKLDELKHSQKEADKLAFGIIDAKLKHPKLSMHQYPIKTFREISGELDMLGISPFNDEHIWNAIENNSRLTKIIYYYHGKESKEYLDKHYHDTRMEFIPDTVFWGA